MWKQTLSALNVPTLKEKYTWDIYFLTNENNVAWLTKVYNYKRGSRDFLKDIEDVKINGNFISWKCIDGGSRKIVSINWTEVARYEYKSEIGDYSDEYLNADWFHFKNGKDEYSKILVWRIKVSVVNNNGPSKIMWLPIKTQIGIEKCLWSIYITKSDDKTGSLYSLIIEDDSSIPVSLWKPISIIDWKEITDCFYIDVDENDTLFWTVRTKDTDWLGIWKPFYWDKLIESIETDLNDWNWLKKYVILSCRNMEINDYKQWVSHINNIKDKDVVCEVDLIELSEFNKKIADLNYDWTKQWNFWVSEKYPRKYFDKKSGIIKRKIISISELIKKDSNLQ
jgi:hypothetical protein